MTVSNSNKENISGWLKNQTVFITGGTGFIGKVLIMKLLKCEVPAIYVLIRGKKGLSAEDRLKVLLNKSTAFESIRQNNPHLLSRVKVIEGNFNQLALGISPEDKEILTENVTIVFNVAASIRFDDSLTQAVYSNLRSTRDVMLLAQTMKRLQVIEHVSTAYTNLTESHIEEKMYPAVIDWRKLIKAVQTLPEIKISAIEQKILSEYSNTYIFTKKLSEDVANDFNKSMPVVIFRPAVVTSPLYEPEPGWIDAYSSPLAFAGGAGQGVLRVYGGPGDKEVNYVSVDTCVYGMIAAAYKRTKQGELTSAPVYNTKTVELSPNLIKKYLMQINNYLPFVQCLWRIYFFPIPNFNLFLVLHVLLHVLPGYIYDGIFKYYNISIRLVRIYRKLYTTFDCLQIFMNREWTFATKNLEDLELMIASDEEDRQKFPMYLPNKNDDLTKFFVSSTKGYRKFVGEPVEPTSAAFIHLKRLYWIDMGFRILVVSFVVWIFPFWIFRSLLGKFQNLLQFIFGVD